MKTVNDELLRDLVNSVSVLVSLRWPMDLSAVVFCRQVVFKSGVPCIQVVFKTGVPCVQVVL